MDAMQKPTHYVTKNTPGGLWIPWPFGYLNINDLDTHIKDLVDIAELPIAAVKFNDAAIWEVGIGWTASGIKIDFLDVKVDVVEKDTIKTTLRDLRDERPDTSTHKYHALGSSLIEANKIINGERQDAYGNPEDSFATIAEYWNTYLIKIQEKLLIDHGHDLENYKLVPMLSALDVAHMMMLFKIARCSGQQTKRDNYIDIQGYAAIAVDRLIKE